MLITKKITMCAAIIVAFAAVLQADDANNFPVWPRIFQKDGSTVVMYQPQIDSWIDYSKMKFRAAIAVTPKDANKTEFGVLAVQADTDVDNDARMVLISNLDKDLRFSGLPDDQASRLQDIAITCLPKKDYINISLDEVVAYMHKSIKSPKVSVNLSPPPIFYSDTPAILVIFVGQPQFKPIKGTKLMFAVNTNWVLIMDMDSSSYYLLNGDSWLTTSDPLKGPWVAATSLPTSLSSLPSDGGWEEARKHIPGSPPDANLPQVFTSTKPAELIVTDGPPEYSPISGTRLMYVSNPQMPLFLDMIDNTYYYLVAGRWFSAESLTGPWSSASLSMPYEFAKIPADCPVGYVLASIPKTQEAQDAVLLASIPHKATINIRDANLTVTYNGDPKFVQIQGTAMSYAVNTPYQVILLDSKYFCCNNGVWFKATSALGPWSVCTAIPNAIYSIPSSSPLYNTTYVKIYNSTPTTVDVGYTDGYSGSYVSDTGTLMFGAGITDSNDYDYDDSWYLCCPCYYSYGCGAYYSYAYGGYYRNGGVYYGPYGGAGWGAAYNPATGAWGRAGYAYGAGGARWGAQAYNPFTNTYAQRTGGTNGYQSWGKTAVTQDGKWAQAGHISGAAGSAGYIKNSSGQWAKGVQTAGGATAIKTSSGNVYAGKDGNVYKKSDGQWQKYQGNGNWEDTSRKRAASSSYSTQDRTPGNQSQNRQDRDTATSRDTQNRPDQRDVQQGLNTDSWARDRGNYNTQSSWSNRSSGGRGGGGGYRGGGGGRGGGRR